MSIMYEVLSSTYKGGRTALFASSPRCRAHMRSFVLIGRPGALSSGSLIDSNVRGASGGKTAAAVSPLM